MSNTWSQSQYFVTAVTFVTHLKSVNDVSQRAVRLIEDYHECVTNGKETCQQLLQVIERHLRHLPLLTKKRDLKRFRTPVRSDYQELRPEVRL